MAQSAATFHQTDGPQVAIVQEQMSVVLHDGTHYQNKLIIRVTSRDGLIAAMLEYYGRKADEDLLRRPGFPA